MSVLTILVMLIIGHLMVSLLCYAYFRKNPNYVLKLSFTAQVLLVLAYLLLIYRAVFPNIINIILSNSLLVSALSIQATALLVSIDAWNNKIRKIYIVVLSIIMSIFYIYVFFENKDSMRIVIITFASIAIFIYPMYKLIFDKKSTFLRKILGITCSASVFIFLIRIIYAIKPDSAMTLLGSNITNTLSFVALYVLMIVNGVGLLLVIKENDDTKLILEATRDSLTGIYNRGFIIDECNKQIEMHRRKKLALTFLVIDLDHFKNVNDHYGHNVGDKVLKHFTNRVSTLLRPYDLFGRVGGEEFVIMLPNTEFDDGYRIAERLRSEIEKTSVESVKITVSIGLHVTVPEAETDFGTIFKAADEEMYIIKNTGRNSVGFK